MKIHLNANGIKVFGIVCTLILFFLFFMVSYQLLRQWENTEEFPPTSSGNYENEGESLVYLDGTAFRLRDDLTTLLLLGIDNVGEMKSSGSYLNDGQCDVVTLLVLDETNQNYTLIHLDRDTMTQVQRLGVGGQVVDSEVMQLALAHTYGDGMEESCENTVDAVQNLLYDTPIDHYLSINMSGLAQLVDAVGGVTVTIQGDFSQVDPSLVEGESMKLNGQQCLTYLRGRSQVGTQTNLERKERQKQFLEELLTQAESDYSVSDLSEVSAYMLTDLNASRLERLIDRIQNADFKSVVTPVGEAVKGQEYMEFYVDEAALKELVIWNFYEPVEE